MGSKPTFGLVVFFFSTIIVLKKQLIRLEQLKNKKSIEEDKKIFSILI